MLKQIAVIAASLLALAAPVRASGPGTAATVVTPSFPSIGVNLSGMDFSGGPFDPTFLEAVYYKSRFSNGIVRLPFLWEVIQPTVSSPLNATALANLTAVVRNMQAQNLNIMLDLHNYCTYNNVGYESGGFTQAQFVDVWTRLAAAFPPAAFPRVNIDLMNEPANCTAAHFGTLSQAAINAIRGQGFTNYIFVEGGGSYSSALGFVTTGWAAVASTLTDSQNKLIFQPHSYLDSDQSGSHNTCVVGAGSTALVAATTYASANHLKLFLGEFGIANNATCLSENAAQLNYMQANPGVWVGWSAWGGGPAWGQSYIFNLDPPSLIPPYTDNAQMLLLTSYR